MLNYSKRSSLLNGVLIKNVKSCTESDTEGTGTNNWLIANTLGKKRFNLIFLKPHSGKQNSSSGGERQQKNILFDLGQCYKTFYGRNLRIFIIS